MAKEEDLPLLYGLLDKEEIRREMYHTLKPDYLYYGASDKNAVYFAILTHACVAIRKISSRSGIAPEEVSARLSDIFRDGSHISFVTNTDPGENAYEAIASFIRSVCSPDFKAEV